MKSRSYSIIDQPGTTLEDQMKQVRLKYLRRSTSKYQPGFVYLHHFGTGHQELVFATHDDASKFANANGTGISRPLILVDWEKR